MGTRSSIAILREGGAIDSVYCHWDGYPSHNGRILQENYNTKEKVEELIAHGSISSLAPQIGQKHDPDDVGRDWSKPREWTKFYARDCGEEVEISHYATFAEWLAAGPSYNYLFDPVAGSWTLTERHSGKSAALAAILALSTDAQDSWPDEPEE